MTSDTSGQPFYLERPDAPELVRLDLSNGESEYTKANTSNIITMDFQRLNPNVDQYVYFKKDTFAQPLYEIIKRIIDSFFDSFALVRACDTTFFTFLLNTLDPEEFQELGSVIRYIDQKYPQFGNPVLSARYDEDFGEFGYFEITLRDCNIEEWRSLSIDIFDKLISLKGKVVPVCLKGLKE
ncbi:MAG: hypothetical protein M0Z77_11175 [Thermoplasmatales archaeon]|nr:hypothetical protein [Thermoplasmatales archaeon]